MITFLKKLGQIIQSGLQIWAGFAPVIQAAVPGSNGIVQTVSKDWTEIANVVVAVEAMGAATGLPGAEKARIAAPQIAQILMQTAALAGKPIADQALFLKGCQEIAGGVADCLNAVHQSAVESTPVPMMAPVA